MPIFSVIPDADRLMCEVARHLTPLRHLGMVRLQWLSATPPINPESLMQSNRVHATTEIDGRTVHVDWVRNSNQKRGPGRALTEFRALVDGQLAGRGGSWGSSLGAGGRDLPLVARIGADTAITLDHLGRGLPIVELWEVDACSEFAVESGVIAGICDETLPIAFAPALEFRRAAKRNPMKAKRW